MSPQVREIALGTALNVFRDGDVLHFFVKSQVILCVFDPKEKAGAAFVLRDFARALDHLRSRFGGEPKRLELKLIAPANQCAALREEARRLGLSLSRVYEPQTDRLEVYFFAGDGRLRVAEAGARPSEGAKAPAPARPHAPSADPARAVANVIRAAPARKKRVLIVDDSKTMRQLLHRIISASPHLEVAGEADLPSKVEGLLRELKPDVMTLDINMPEMSGVALLQKLAPRPFPPTVMITAIGLDEGKEVLKAFELGAVDYIQKPSAEDLASMVPLIQEKILSAAGTQRRENKAVPRRIVRALGQKLDLNKFIAVGASTGGTEAIKTVFMQLPDEIPPIAVVQHIPPYFSTAFANRLNELCPFEVREAQDGDEFRPGLALIAPGGLHMEVVKRGGKLYAKVFDAEPVNRFKPSVDVLFRSVAATLGPKAIGILMTGMGNDGAKGLLAMKEKGAKTIAQDEESCVVFGMPRAAIELGAAHEIAPLDDIAELALKLVA